MNLTKITHFDEKHAKARAYTQKWRQFGRFKIDSGRFFAFLDAQGGVCAICGAEYDEKIWVPVRNSRVVLGIVCPKCAKGLWKFGYDPLLVGKARAFLDSAPELTYPYIRYGFEEMEEEIIHGFDNY